MRTGTTNRDANTTQPTMPHHSDTDAMTAVIQNNLSPQAVALIAAKLQVCYCSPGPNEAMVEAEQQCQWFTGLLIRMLGNDQFQSLCDELGF